MSRATLILVLALCLACIGLGYAFGAYNEGRISFDAHECFTTTDDDGNKLIDCRKTVMGLRPAGISL